MNSFYLRSAALLLGCILGLSANAASPVSSDLFSGWNSINQTTIKSDIAYLASDQLEGRLSLTKGDETTTQWLVNQFKNAGLKPANGDSYLQSFSIIQFTPDKKQSYIRLKRDNKTIVWKKADVFTEFYHDINISSQIVFVGYGITAPELKYDDYQNVDVKGKFVLAFEHEPQETNPSSIFNGTGNTPYATNRIKALNAQKHGAIGILIMPEPNRNHPSNLERYNRIGGSATRKMPLPSMVIENDELQIPIAILSDNVAKKIAGKLSLSQFQHQIDQDLIPKSQVIHHAIITLQDRVKSSKVATSSNVVGLLEGSDPTLKSETIIISAHHDHDGKSGKEIWHGADDNASGTAGVLTLAQAISANNTANNGLKTKRTILFAVFAAEERGLLGSYYMASHPLRPLNTTRAMINFDMIGRDEKRSVQTNGLINIPSDTHNRLNLIGAHFSPDYAKTVKDENQFVGLTLDERFDNESALNTFFRSDQFPFVLKNVPAFWWFTGFHPDYHHTTDTADKIDYPKMQKILRLAYLSAYQFANNTTPPKFIADPQPKS